MTPLDKPLKRALKIGAVDFVLTLTPSHLKLTEKGKRNGLELAWSELVSGESALAVALQASLGQFSTEPAAGTAPKRAIRSRSTNKKAANGKIQR